MGSAQLGRGVQIVTSAVGHGGTNWCSLQWAGVSACEVFAVEWNYARERAESSVKRVRGVKGVTNAITLKPTVQPHEIRRKIEDALRRSAELEASRIKVEANDPVPALRPAGVRTGRRFTSAEPQARRTARDARRRPR
jgi:osmotically-inducible protein OsmY